ncbi:porin [Cupriavidus pinatubonensis]|nr:porin [Cupriavidus pinatubonensis]
MTLCARDGGSCAHRAQSYLNGTSSMKKKWLIALTTLGTVAGVAQAQSSVTLYGVLDTNVEVATNMKAPSGGSGTRYALNGGGLSSSRWGLRGNEDLGGGLSGIFVLESGFSADDGKSLQGGRLFGRQAFVGLQNATFGKVTFGRQYTSMLDALAPFSPAALAVLYEPVIALFGAAYRQDNTVKYTGTFGPLMVGAHWSFGIGPTFSSPGGVNISGSGEVPGQIRRDSGFGGQTTYRAGSFGATLSYDQVNPSITRNGALLDIATSKKAAAAASYALGPIQIMGGYRWGKAVASGQTLVRDDLYWAGVSYEAARSLSLTLDYYYQAFHSSTTPALKPPGNPWQVAFIVDYNLSKRTDLYWTTVYAKNSGLCLDTASIGYANGYQPGGTRNNMLGAAVGLRHKF